MAVRRGSVYVADVYNHRISVFPPTAATPRCATSSRAALAPSGFERTIGQLGSDPGLFEFPRGVAVTPHGWLLVAEPKRLQLLALDGTPLQLLKLELCGAQAMRGVCCDAHRAYVADYEAHVVHVLQLDATTAPPPGGAADGAGALFGRVEAAAGGATPADEERERIEALLAGGRSSSTARARRGCRRWRSRGRLTTRARRRARPTTRRSTASRASCESSRASRARCEAPRATRTPRPTLALPRPGRRARRARDHDGPRPLPCAGVRRRARRRGDEGRLFTPPRR